MSQIDWSQAAHWMSPALDVATRFLNSNFTVAAIGALAGAYAGARGAQHIAERSKLKETLVAELNATNSAIMLSFTVCNSALGLKKQIVGPLYDGFMRDRAEYIKARSEPQAGRFAYTANLISFAAPLVPIEVLRDLVLQRTSAYGKAAGLVPLVQNAASGLTNAMRQRDEIITLFKTSKIPEVEQHWHYFGVQNPSGHTYREYSDVVEVIHSYTNDLIYFSAALCDALVQHGKRVQARFKGSAHDLPTVTEPDFSGPKNTGLFPPDSDYGSWQAWIVERNDPSASTRKGDASMTENQGVSSEDSTGVQASASQIYEVLTSLVMHSEQTRWVRVNALLVVDSVFVAAWAGIFVGTTPFAGKESLLLVLCVPGFVLGVAFAFLGWRSSQYMDDFHDQAHALEQQFPAGLPRPFHASEERRRALRSGAFRFTSSKWLVTVIPLGFSTLFAYLGAVPFLLTSCTP